MYDTDAINALNIIAYAKYLPISYRIFSYTLSSYSSSNIRTINLMSKECWVGK